MKSLAFIYILFFAHNASTLQLEDCQPYGGFYPSIPYGVYCPNEVNTSAINYVDSNRTCLPTNFLCGNSAETSRCPGEISLQSKRFCENDDWASKGCGMVRQSLVQRQVIRYKRCLGQRKGQCVLEPKFCNGFYDCIDRSDESNCSEVRLRSQVSQHDVLIDGEKKLLDLPFHDKNVWAEDVMKNKEPLCRDTQLRVGKVHQLAQFTRKCNISFSKDKAKPGLQFGTLQDCISLEQACRDYTAVGSYEFHVTSNCPPFWRFLESDFFCLNASNFDQYENLCSLRNSELRKGHKRCGGNAPSRCFVEESKYESDTICPNNGHYDYNVGGNESKFRECVKRGNFVCENNQTCIHKTLLCDGYEQCEDGSDEGYSRCGNCPSFGYLKQGDHKDATFSCQHRYTKKPICAIPCNNEDDLCFENADETNCDKSVNFVYLWSVLIITLVLILIMGEITYRCADCYKLEFDFDVSRRENYQEDNFVSKFVIEAQRNLNDNEKLENIYRSIHSNESLVKVLISALNITFEGDDKRDIFKLIYEFELKIHDDYKSSAETCLKTELETNLTSTKFWDGIYPGIFNRIFSSIKEKLPCGKNNKGDKNYGFKIIKSGLKLSATFLFQAIVYYLDLVKDIFFILILNFIVQDVTKNSTFPADLLKFLISIIVINEILKLVILIAMRHVLRLRRKELLLMTIFFPLIPAICLYHMTRLRFVRRKLRLKIMEHSQNSDSKKFAANWDTILEHFKILDTRISNLIKFVGRIKSTENVVENLPQVVIVAILLSIIESPTTPINVLKNVLKPNLFIYASAIWSFVTIVRTGLNYVDALNGGLLPVKKLLLIGLFNFFGVLSRLWAVFLYFSPSLGLLPILWHWKMGSISTDAGENLVYDVVTAKDGTERKISFPNVWKMTENLEDSYTLMTYKAYFAILMIFCAANCVVLFLVKWNFVPKFKTEGRLVEKICNVFDSLLFPSKYQPWQEIGCSNERDESNLMNIVWFAFGNIFLTFPLWILKHKVNRRNEYLEEQFQPLPEEAVASNLINALLISSMIIFIIITPLIQLVLIGLIDGNEKRKVKSFHHIRLLNINKWF